MVHKNKCSVCGLVGHSKRTCNKAVSNPVLLLSGNISLPSVVVPNQTEKGNIRKPSHSAPNPLDGELENSDHGGSDADELEYDGGNEDIN